tara:strand:+ start:2829 stop:3284 length:456 start_codon:yes stop_codon:yes gene_type:complete
MSPEGLTSTLRALKKAGSVYGVILSKQHEVISSDVPFQPEQVSELSTILDDISFYFAQENRNPDQLAFSYDGGNLVILFNGEFRMVVLHHHASEVDFVAGAAESLFKDYITSKVVERFANSSTTPALSKSSAAEVVTPRSIDPTAPIAPAV